ncbi:MAG: hypothetical protein ABS81_19085 [Pseudonocardia sp. SCN 72-86]|nr:MAG: hypothetical protein ABS81_19085 [Pseudonocardia sp. SCN 72-86]
MRRPVSGTVLAIAAVFLVGCSSPPPAQPVPSALAPVTAEPAGDNPSESAVLVCSDEAKQDITEALAVPPQSIDTPTWSDHVYSCRYRYDGGAFTLSVKELSSVPETTAFFDETARRLGSAHTLDGLGEGAFVTTDGSVVVRKDFKVLVVDDSALPPGLGTPPLTPPQVALLVARTIIGCWTGA